GTNTAATQVIRFSVSWLDVASHMVRLAFIMVLEGITNGNIAIPAVRMMQASVREENRNAHAPFSIRDVRIVSSGRTTPRAGTNHRIGALLKFTSHAPASRATSLVSGLDAA